MGNRIVHIRKDNADYDIDVSKITHLARTEVIRQDKRFVFERIDDYNLDIYFVSGERIYLRYELCSKRDKVYEEILKAWNEQDYERLKKL